MAIKREIFGHPTGLFVLFFTEMWERFSYYGMRALLIYYMIKHLAMPQETASNIYGLYTGLVYLTPIFGGILADRLLGKRYSVILGAVLMTVGHFLMAFEALFVPALIFLILGNGAFKPNISTQVGALYADGDPRRDRAFSIFYVGINLGAFFSPLVCGTLGELYGWHYGFSAAGIGMAIGLCVYLWGNKYLPREEPNSDGIKSDDPGNDNQGNGKIRIIAIAAFCLITIAFWAAYEQQGNTLALWADANTDRVIAGFKVPASWFQSLNPAFIFILTPLIVSFWSWQSKSNSETSAPVKLAIGCFLLGLSFLIMIPAAMIHLTFRR